MLLCELFGNDGGSNVVDEMRSMVIDVLTPLAASKVPYVTVQQIVDRLQEVRSGVRIDRSLIMTILDPNTVQMVDKIEGDRIYLMNPQPDAMAQREEDEEANKEKVRQKANQQAQKQVKDQSNLQAKAVDTAAATGL